MSSRYSGMCIGGPKDGAFAKSDREWVTIPLELPIPRSPALYEPIPLQAVVDRVTYRHVAFHFRNSDRPGREETRGFWTPENIQDQHLYVLDQLAAAYRTRADG